MKIQVLSVQDLVSKTYGTPYYSVSIGSAIRGFTDEINRADENNLLYKHPNDFNLVHLGSFDDDLGLFELFSYPETLITGFNSKLPNKG